MSLWDGIIVLLLAIAIFQGYRRGFLLRITGWVGGLTAFFLAYPLSSAIDAPVSKFVNGEEIIAKSLQERFVSEYNVSDFINGKNFFHWIDSNETLKEYRVMMVDYIEKVSSNLYSSMSEAISHLIAVPAWKMILVFIAWLFIMFLLVVFGRLAHYLIEKFYIVSVVDSFLGVFISLVAIFVVLIIINTIGLTFIPKGNGLGDMIHQSFFAPFFKNIFYLFIK